MRKLDGDLLEGEYATQEYQTACLELAAGQRFALIIPGSDGIHVTWMGDRSNLRQAVLLVHSTRRLPFPALEQALGREFKPIGQQTTAEETLEWLRQFFMPSQLVGVLVARHGVQGPSFAELFAEAAHQLVSPVRVVSYY